jgi:hypothetical protein
VKHNGPTLVDRPGPKWMRILGIVVKSHGVTIPHRYRRKAATYGHQPINLRNGITRCRLSAMTEQVTSRMPQRVGCPEKPRPRVMPGICRRGAGIRDGKGTYWRPKLMTPVLDGVKLGLRSTSWRSFAKRPLSVSFWAVLMTTARIFRSRMKRKFHVRF